MIKLGANPACCLIGVNVMNDAVGIQELGYTNGMEWQALGTAGTHVSLKPAVLRDAASGLRERRAIGGRRRLVYSTES
jgi:hypothetical protein